MLASLAGIRMEDDSLFHVDFLKRELRDALNPENTIPIAKMNEIADGYTFKYDPDIRNIAASDKDTADGTYQVQVLHLTKMQPEMMAFLYGVPNEAVIGKTDQEFFADLPVLREQQAAKYLEVLDYDLWEKRIAGILPEVIIADERFIVKWDEKMMYSLRNPEVKIDFTRLRLNPDLDGYYCFLDLNSKQPIYRPTVADYSENLGICFLPDEAYIDPIGVARSRGFNDIDLLYRFPLVEKTIAEVLKVTKMTFIRSLTPSRSARNAVKRVNRRRGKGL